MSTAPSGSTSPAAAPAADPSKQWAPHGPLLTACLVGLNLLMVLLIFFYFWRFFSGKRGPPTNNAGAGGAADEEASSAGTSPASSPRASWRLRGWPAGGQEEDILSSLPVSVYSAGSDVEAGGQGKAAECAVCIVEFRDGDRARLLPRCGHRFHADCVGAWLQLHATCPLCRASVLAPAATGAASEPKNDDDPKNAAGAAAAEEDCPV